MEKTERTKYYPINLKDKKLHTEFMVLERQNGDKNVDETLKSLLDDSKWLKNVIESNNDLRKDLSEAKKKIRELEERLNYCRDRIDRNEMEDE